MTFDFFYLKINKELSDKYNKVEAVHLVLSEAF